MNKINHPWNREFSRSSGNNSVAVINNFYLENFGISFSDIRAAVSQVRTACKRLGKKYVSPLEIDAYGTTVRLGEEKIQETLDKIPTQFLSHRTAEGDEEMFVYSLTADGEEIDGRFSGLHSDMSDRLSVERMRERGGAFNLASRRANHPGRNSAR